MGGRRRMWSPGRDRRPYLSLSITAPACDRLHHHSRHPASRAQPQPTTPHPNSSSPKRAPAPSTMQTGSGPRKARVYDRLEGQEVLPQAPQRWAQVDAAAAALRPGEWPAGAWRGRWRPG